MVHRQRFADAQQVRLKAAQRVLGLELEDVVGELVRLAELVARDRMQRCQFLLRGCPLFREMPVAEQVADPIGIAEVAAIEGLKRIAPERAFVAVLEQLEQAIVNAGLGRPRRAGHNLCRCRRDERQHRTGQDQRANEVQHFMMAFRRWRHATRAERILQEEALRLGRNASSINSR